MMDGASKDDPRTKEEVPVPFVEGSSLHGCSKNRPPTKQNRLLIGDPTLSWKVSSSFSPHSFLFSVSRRAFLPRCCCCCSLFPWLMYCCHELGIAAWSSYSFSRQFVPTYTHVPCFYWSPVSTTGYCFCLSLSVADAGLFLSLRFGIVVLALFECSATDGDRLTKWNVLLLNFLRWCWDVETSESSHELESHVGIKNVKSIVFCCCRQKE